MTFITEDMATLVTPAMATDMLKNNSTNREISEERVERYIRAMAAGKWHWIGDPLRFDADLNLLDGQHRLMAVEASGVSCKFLIISGLPVEAQKYMDSGRARSAADNIRMLGLKQPTIVGATARLILSITNPLDEDGKWDGEVRVGQYSGRVTGWSNHEIADFAAANPELQESADAGVQASYRVQAQPTVLSFMHCMTRRIDVEASEDFMTKLTTGADLQLGDPVYAARETINRNRRDGSRDGHMNLYLLIRAWNLTRNTREVSRLQLPAGGIVSSTKLIME